MNLADYNIMNWIVAFFGIVWLIFSIIMILHWISYSKNPFMTTLTMSIYVLASLAIFGFMMISL